MPDKLPLVNENYLGKLRPYSGRLYRRGEDLRELCCGYNTNVLIIIILLRNITKIIPTDIILP